MCGIAGVASGASEKKFQESLLLAMRDCMETRGPDDAGIQQFSGAALVSRRLAVLDLSPNGHMPMRTPDGRYALVYNGEIYNFRELRDELIKKGVKFRSGTDTEVLLQLYALEGPAMLERLNGMFAFAVWDDSEKKLFAARDRMGVKPFYYAERSGDFYFASEAKALFQAGIPKTLDTATLEELVFFRSIAGEATPFKGVRRLLPGHSLVWKRGSFSVKRWWDLRDAARRGWERPLHETAEWFESVFTDAVRLRQISDVPVGVLLSGGMDSASIAAMLAETGAKTLQSFTVGFEEEKYDERPLARMLSEKYGLQNHECVLRPGDLPELLNSAVDYQDEPPAHASDLHLLAISRQAKKNVTVLLSGEGGDETLGGYNRYLLFKRPFFLQAAAPLAELFGLFSKHTRFAKLRELLALKPSGRRILFSASEIFPRETGRIFTAGFPYREKIIREAEEVYPRDQARQAMYYDQHSYLCSILDRNDRMTMAASIECRTPFLDYRLVEGLAAVPSRILMAGPPKFLLRKAMAARLPEKIMKNRKWGFGVPWGRYLRTVAPWREEVRRLPQSGLLREAGFDQRMLTERVRDFQGGDISADALVYQCFILNKWHERIFKNS